MNSVYAEVGLPLTDRVSLQVAGRQEEYNLEQGAGTFLPPYERRFGAQLYWDLLQ